MGWLILLVCGAIIWMDIAISTEESTPIPPQREYNGTWFTTGHYRFSLFKGEGLEIEKCQMN